MSQKYNVLSENIFRVLRKINKTDNFLNEHSVLFIPMESCKKLNWLIDIISDNFKLQKKLGDFLYGLIVTIFSAFFIPF